MRQIHALFAASCLVAVAAASPASAQAVSFHLAALPAAQAIQEFGRQAGVEIFARSDVLANVLCNPVQGRYEVRKALAMMLAGTPLSVASDDGKVLVIDRAVVQKPSLLIPIATQATPSPAPTERAIAATTLAAPTGLEEIVVTATRQTSTVNKVAMSIAAVTQRSLDEQGLRETTDLTKVVPQLTITGQATGVATFGVRGIVASTGAATTGVYIDDTNITKRNNAGVSQNNGAPLPILFDLDRVEVLKGPQGTLYGGSSEGGTVRFITPTPSLTTYSGVGRAGLSQIEGGSPSNEYGVAFGGPIIQDKVGLRLSAVSRTTGGWISVEDPYPLGAQGPGSLVEKNANQRSEWATRGSVLWQITPDFSGTLQAYHSEFDYMGGPDSSTVVFDPTGNINFGQVYTTPATCYNTSTYKVGSTPAATPCPGTALPGQTVNGIYMRPQASYGPFNYIGKNVSISPSNGIIDPTSTITNVDTVTLNYNLPGVAVKSITSYLGD